MESKETTMRNPVIEKAFDTEMCDVPLDEESINETTAWNALSNDESDFNSSKHGILNNSTVVKEKSLQNYNLTCNKPLLGYDGNTSRLDSMFRRLPETERIFPIDIDRPMTTNMVNNVD